MLVIEKKIGTSSTKYLKHYLAHTIETNKMLVTVVKVWHCYVNINPQHTGPV